jgi:hypothetical protein
MPRVRVVAQQGEVEEVRYRKSDDGRYYKHETETPTDLFLVDVNGKRGSLMLPRGTGHGWERDGSTHWLTNPPSRRRMATKRKAPHKSTKRRATTRRKAKRSPPHGFKTWSAYMASIRPNSSTGGTMAKRKRRGGRKATARRPKSRARRRRVYAANPAHRTRRRYRRNPGFSVNRIIEQVKDGAIGAVAVVGGEAVTRLTRSRVLSMTAGTTLASATELGIATAIGILGERVVGRQIARDMLIGGYAGVLRATAKQLGVPLVAEALSDDGPRVIRVNGARRLSGYGAPSRLSGYAAPGMDRLAGEESEMYGG